MYPILFKVGDLSVYAYGFMVGLAFIIATLISMYYAKKEGIRAEVILEMAILIIIFAIIGSRMFHVINHWTYYKGHLVEIVQMHKGGLAFLGGLVLVIPMLVVYTKIKKIPLMRFLDILAPGTALGYALARIGCFLGGCCFGLPANVPWAVCFPSHSPADHHFPGQSVHPTQLYSFGAMVVVFIIIAFLYQHKKYDGQIFWWWLVLYGAYRFPMDFIRHSEIYWGGLTPHQWITMILAFTAVIILMVKKNPSNK